MERPVATVWMNWDMSLDAPRQEEYREVDLGVRSAMRLSRGALLRE
jgi:hypothetical protein